MPPKVVSTEPLSYALFGLDHRLHHALRLLMKLVAFAALAGVALRYVEAAAGARLDARARLTLLALAASLFFYFPNNPEARLAPQEARIALHQARQRGVRADRAIIITGRGHRDSTSVGRGLASSPSGSCLE